MKNKIKECIDKITSSKIGHLPLKNRLELLQSINDEGIINKIYFECSKKVLLTEIANIDDVYFTLQKCREYLYKQQYNLELDEIADKTIRHIIDKQGSDFALAYCVYSLSYSISSFAESTLEQKISKVKDDDRIEYEEWFPDFWASIVYSGGNGFFNEGFVEKRREFWFWYLEVVEALVKDGENEILPFPIFQIKPITILDKIDFKKINQDTLSELIKRIIKETLDKTQANVKIKDIKVKIVDNKLIIELEK